ncbi:hypothetical protein [Roseateles cavernae]|uniref:hypothetical protein n=1 Tax=Roseateles cavernae TaxID=3153578 RepID=UPI0032E491FB
MSAAKQAARQRYSPMNPPRLQRPDESLSAYRIEMGWDHAPARQCVICEGFCLEQATVDQAMTALATARGKREHLAAYEALVIAARTEIVRLRAEIAGGAT